MSDKLQAIRGMNDVLPHETPLWRHIESVFAQLLRHYGYHEIRFPILEHTELFERTIGEVTDIVEKEMYTFADRNGDSLTLRPEGTAGCVRACIEHGLIYNQQQKLWYNGPVFRHEKPQKGRYRQFHQFGVEAFGFSGIAIELELLALCRRLWERLEVSQSVQLQVNTLGTREERATYRDQLVAYFNQHVDKLDEDSQRRLDKNPLRILDSKNPEMQDIINAAPKLMASIGEESRAQFDALCKGLEALGIAYSINPRLVRGLDYYGGLVFEWVTECLGSQGTVCAGGRFDKLIEDFGGQPTPAIGFGIGAERLILLLQALNQGEIHTKMPLAFLMGMGDDALTEAVLLAEKIREGCPDEAVIVNTAGGGFKSQFKKADKSGARFAIILGEEELAKRQVSVKDLRMGEEQVLIQQDQLIDYLKLRS